MFNLTLHDHLQLTFNEIIQRHAAHAAKAQSRARWTRRLKGIEAVLIGGVGMAAAGAALGHGQVLAIVAAALASIALVALLVDLTFDFDASARAHATCSAHLWGLRERYRSLLSDLHDGAINIADARIRRDRLMEELRGIYETTSVIALEQDFTPLAIANETAVESPPEARRSA
ncbi:MAG: SLATT domain-containing protein [Vicinamibacterales bacterium]